MEQYKVKIFPTAQCDLNDIVDYLNTLSREAALKYYDLIVEQISRLQTMPMRCALVRDPQLRLRGYRLLPVKNYAVFFVINENTVEIRRILYSKRRYQDFL